MPASKFDPRRATLNHAAESRVWADRLSTDANGAVAMAIGELANAVACGLVYIGDAICREHAAGATQDAAAAEAIGRVRNALLVLTYPEGTAPSENAPDGTYGGSREVDDGDTGN